MPSRHCLSTGIVPLNLHVARLQAGANWKCIMMHTAYTARRQKATFTVACSTQTHLRVAKLGWWESCYLKKTCNIYFKHVFAFVSTCSVTFVTSPSWPMCFLRETKPFLWNLTTILRGQGRAGAEFSGPSLHAESCKWRPPSATLP